MQKHNFLKKIIRLDFVRQRMRVKREYDEPNVRINSLPESIRRRSDTYNAYEMLQAKNKQMEMGGNLSEPIKVLKATWMANSSTWSLIKINYSKGDHVGIIQVIFISFHFEFKKKKNTYFELGENLNIEIPTLIL